MRQDRNFNQREKSERLDKRHLRRLQRVTKKIDSQSNLKLKPGERSLDQYLREQKKNDENLADYLEKNSKFSEENTKKRKRFDGFDETEKMKKKRKKNESNGIPAIENADDKKQDSDAENNSDEEIEGSDVLMDSSQNFDRLQITKRILDRTISFVPESAISKAKGADLNLASSAKKKKIQGTKSVFEITFDEKKEESIARGSQEESDAKQFRKSLHSQEEDEEDMENKNGYIIDEDTTLIRPEYSLFQGEKVEELMNWTMNKSIGPGFHNLGNTCFMNSTLQCLVHTPPLCQYLLARKISSKNFNALDAMSRLAKQCFSDKDGENGKKNGRISPSEMAHKMKFLGDFYLGAQEDSHEFLINLLDKMERKVLTDCDKNLPRNIKHTNVVNQIFGGFLENTIIAEEAKYVSRRYEPFISLSIPVNKGIDNVRAGLQSFFKPDVLDGENKYCLAHHHQKRYVRAIKAVSIYKPPKILIIHLKKFNAHGRKIGKRVDFEELIDLTEFCSTIDEKYGKKSSTSNEKYSNSEENVDEDGDGDVEMENGESIVSLLGGNQKMKKNKKNKKNHFSKSETPKKTKKSDVNDPKNPNVFELYGVLVHDGYSVDSGHYYCFIKSPSGVWHLMNDSYVSKVGINGVLGSNPYLLFYRQKNVGLKTEESKPKKKEISLIEIPQNTDISPTPTKQKEPKEIKEAKESKEIKEAKESKEIKEIKQVKEMTSPSLQSPKKTEPSSPVLSTTSPFKLKQKSMLDYLSPLKVQNGSLSNTRAPQSPMVQSSPRTPKKSFPISEKEIFSPTPQKKPTGIAVETPKVSTKKESIICESAVETPKASTKKESIICESAVETPKVSTKKESIIREFDPSTFDQIASSPSKKSKKNEGIWDTAAAKEMMSIREKKQNKKKSFGRDGWDNLLDNSRVPKRKEKPEI